MPSYPFRLRFLLTALLALVAAASVHAGDPTGTWKFKISGAGERSAESTLVLAWAGGRLSGTIKNRLGPAEIGAASFANDEVKFTVKREIGRRLRKKTVVVHYQGKLEGDTIKGTIETTGREDQPVSVPWEATRAK